MLLRATNKRWRVPFSPFRSIPPSRLLPSLSLSQFPREMIINRIVVTDDEGSLRKVRNTCRDGVVADVVNEDLNIASLKSSGASENN